MTIPDKRFSDPQVRGDSALHDIAWAYARDYVGDWDPMVAAHDLAMETGELPIPVARMVLNVMRADPAAQHLLPKDAGNEVIQLDDYRREVPRRSSQSDNGGKNQMPEQPRHRFPRVVSLRWHRRYVLSTHSMAKVAHILRTVPPSDRRGDAQYGFTTLKWVPAQQRFDVQIKAWCSAHWYSWRHRLENGEEVDYVTGINNLGVILTNDTQDRPICKSCTFHEARYNERYNLS